MNIRIRYFLGFILITKILTNYVRRLLISRESKITKFRGFIMLGRDVARRTDWQLQSW